MPEKEMEEVEDSEPADNESGFSNQMAAVGLHLDEVIQKWDERDKRECAVLWGRLFRENIIQQPLELIRRVADAAGLEKAINNLDFQREEIVSEVMAGVNFLSKKIQSPIDVTAKDLNEIINQERMLMGMTLSQRVGAEIWR